MYYYCLGMVPDSFQSLCINCPGGHSCTDPRFSPQPCPLGTYSLQGISSECHICPQGHSCANQESLPILCPLGSFSTIGSTECIRCPSGASCMNTSLPVPCLPGEYSVEGGESNLANSQHNTNINVAEIVSLVHLYQGFIY